MCIYVSLAGLGLGVGTAGLDYNTAYISCARPSELDLCHLTLLAAAAAAAGLLSSLRRLMTCKLRRTTKKRLVCYFVTQCHRERAQNCDIQAFMIA